MKSKIGVNVSLMCSYDFEVFTDASLTGYGMCYNNKINLAGTWNQEDFRSTNNHINGLELLAIKEGCKIR